MAHTQSRQGIPTHLSLEQFEEFVLPHLHTGSRGPQPKLALHVIFNYILKLLYMGCQWKELPIEKDGEGQPEIHYTRIYGAFRRYEDHGCFELIFAGPVSLLSLKGQLDISVIHGDGTTTAAKKGGDNLGFNGHKHMKGDKVVAFCDRNCNVSRNSRRWSAWMGSTTVGRTAKLFSIAAWCRIFPKIGAVERRLSVGASRCSTRLFFENGFTPSSECSLGKISFGVYSLDLIGNNTKLNTSDTSGSILFA